MIWVSNQAGVNIAVAITANNGQGDPADFQILAGAPEVRADNQWLRGGNEVAAIVLLPGGGLPPIAVGPIAVPNDALVQVFPDRVVVIPGAAVIPFP